MLFILALSGCTPVEPPQGSAQYIQSSESELLAVVQRPDGSRLEAFGLRDSVGVPAKLTALSIQASTDTEPIQVEFFPHGPIRRVEIADGSFLEVAVSDQEGVLNILAYDSELDEYSVTTLDDPTGDDLTRKGILDACWRRSFGVPESDQDASEIKTRSVTIVCNGALFPAPVRGYYLEASTQKPRRLRFSQPFGFVPQGSLYYFQVPRYDVITDQRLVQELCEQVNAVLHPICGLPGAVRSWPVGLVIRQTCTASGYARIPCIVLGKVVKEVSNHLVEGYCEAIDGCENWKSLFPPFVEEPDATVWVKVGHPIRGPEKVLQLRPEILAYQVDVSHLENGPSLSAGASLRIRNEEPWLHCSGRVACASQGIAQLNVVRNAIGDADPAALFDSDRLGRQGDFEFLVGPLIPCEEYRWTVTFERPDGSEIETASTISVLADGRTARVKALLEQGGMEFAAALTYRRADATVHTPSLSVLRNTSVSESSQLGLIEHGVRSGAHSASGVAFGCGGMGPHFGCMVPGYQKVRANNDRNVPQVFTIDGQVSISIEPTTSGYSVTSWFVPDQDDPQFEYASGETLNLIVAGDVLGSRDLVFSFGF